MSSRHVMAVLAGLLAAGPAWGQQIAPPPEPPASKSGLSDPQKLERAARHIDRMKEVVKQALSRLEDARDEKDIVKLNCVNEKLTQVKGLLRVAEQSDVALQEAAAHHDESTEVEYSRIGIARTKVDQLRAEIEECIGQLAFVVDQKTIVEVEQPKDQGSDPTNWEPPPPPVARPPAASPFQ